MFLWHSENLIENLFNINTKSINILEAEPKNVNVDTKLITTIEYKFESKTDFIF